MRKIGPWGGCIQLRTTVHSSLQRISCVKDCHELDLFWPGQVCLRMKLRWCDG